MKKFLAIAIALSSIVSANAFAAENNFAVYTAVGFGFSPSSLRFSAHDYEAGILAIGTNGASIGAIRILRSNSTYTGFGLAYRFKDSIGFHGSVGKAFQWFNWLRFRVEFNGEVYTDSFTQGNALVGLEVTW